MEFKFDCTCFLKATARILVLATLVASVSALAATPLIDFESAAAVDELPYRIRGKNALDIVPVFSTSGTNSLRFTSPLWKKGLPEWPSFELKPTLRDWRGYDRLVVDIINPSPENFFSRSMSPTRAFHSARGCITNLLWPRAGLAAP